MKRDMGLVRAILLTLAEHEQGYAPPNLEIPGYSEEQIGFHAYIMGQAGLLETINMTPDTSRTPLAMAVAITWRGYEFLEAARSDTVWKKAMTQFAKAGVGVSFEVLKQVLLRAAKDQLGIPG
jgi:hypothetical protein